MTFPNKQLGIEELAATYGYAATFFNSDPELRGLIDRAVHEQWTADRFRAAFMASAWYRARNADTRQWVELESRDPATASQRIGNQQYVIQGIANQMGISLPTDRLRKMARDSLMFGWEETQLKEAVAAEFQYRPGGNTAGGAASIEDRIRQYASDYGVSLGDTQVGQWVQGTLAGKFTEEHLRDYARDMARSKYPGMSYYLDQGMTVRQVAAPYVKSYSDLMEIGEDTVNLGTPIIQTALQGVQADANTAPRMRSLFEFERDVRKDPQWLKTKNARDSVQNATLGVLRDFGLYA